MKLRCYTSKITGYIPFFEDIKKFVEDLKNRNGLTRQNFDDFFNDEFKNFGGSNSRLFDDNFFNKNKFSDDFFKSTLPRRFASKSPNNLSAEVEHPIFIKRENESQDSIPMHRKTQSYAENDFSPNIKHKRQSSTDPNYSNNTNKNQSQNFQQQSQYQPNLNESNFKQSQQPKQPTFIEINNSNSNINCKLNPDRFSNNLSKNKANSINNLSKQEANPAISEKAIPLPPPESMIKLIKIDKPEFIEEKLLEKKDLNEDSSQKNQKLNRNNSIGFVPLVQCYEQLINCLDETERRVELLRDTAAQLENEKENVLDILNNIKINAEFLKLKSNEIDELNLTTEYLLKRCKAVDVVVNTPRNEEQLRAINEVNKMINEQISKMNDNISYGKEKIESFLNACNPNEPTGPIDERFQSKIVECTADDQKKIRGKLTQIIAQYDRAKVVINSINL